LLLVTYSLGLGIPFIVSALVLDKLRGAFGFIKRHYRVINMVCGIFLIAVGVLMATGLFDKFMALFI
jgi:cytochrome c-type biogenesis protein